MRTAALWDELTGWEEDPLGDPLVFSPGGGSPAGGTPFLTTELGDPNARVIVRAAFGADIKGNPALWNFYDITADVRQADGNRVAISPMGRSDESSQAQPAGCGFQLDNTSGNYTRYHPGSKWWPNVRENTPIQVQLYIYGQLTLEYQGYANGWVPSWDTSGNLAVVTVACSGILRRLQQGKTPLRSPLTRSIPRRPVPPVAWWPIEDGTNSTQAASGLASGAPMTTTGMTFAADTDLGGAAPLAKLSATSYLSGQVNHTFTDRWQVDWYMRQPSAPSGLVVFMRIWLSGAAIDHLDFYTGFNGVQNVNRVIGYLGSTVVTDSGDFLPSLPFDDWFHFYITAEAASTPGTTKWWFLQAHAGALVTGANLGSYTGFVGNITSVEVPTDSRMVAASIGQVAVTDVFAQLADTNLQGGTNWFVSSGYAGENVIARLARLCAEEGIPLEVVGTSDTTMGPQGTGAFVSLLRKCETTEDGLLGDGRGPGLYFITRSARYNRPAALSPDMAADPPQVDDPFAPADDDQRTRNIIKADRENGSSATYEDTSSPLGTDTIHDYDSTVTVNYADDSGLLNRAAHEVKKGTVEGFRYPTLKLDLAAIPALVPAWRATPLAGRIDVLNVTSKATQHPPGTVSLLLEGYGASLSPFDWEVACTCSPFQPWRVAVLDSTVDEYGWRLESGASLLHQDYPAGSTSLLVDVSDGYFWSTVAGDYPRDFDIGGVRVTVTAVAGASSPQTFTVAATVYPLYGGSAVKLWRLPRLAL